MNFRNSLLIFYIFTLIGCGNGINAEPNTTNSTSPSGSSPAVSTPKYIFVTTNAVAANFGGISAADTACNSDANKTNSSTYKAMLVDGTNSTRKACTTSNCSGGTSEHTDWPLVASTQYKRTDGTVIGTTDSNGLFTFPLTNSFAATSYNLYTGLSTDFTSATTDCSHWTTNNSGTNGNYGSSAQVNTNAIDVITFGCNNVGRFVCVEQ